MTHIQKLEQPVTVTLPSGDWLPIEGLLTKEWSKISKDPSRKPYYETLTRIRQVISEAQSKVWDK